MYMIATTHPVGLRTFSTRAEAVDIAAAWGLAPFRIYLNFRHPERRAPRVPIA